MKAMGTEEGKRGRRPVDDKKVRVTIYIRQSQIKELGGAGKCQQLATDHLEAMYKLIHYIPKPEDV